MTRRGVTLLELLLASMIGLVVVLGLSKIDVTRIYLSQEVQNRTRGPSEAMLVLSSIIKDLEQADRAVLYGPDCGGGTPSSCLKFRIPIGTDFDNTNPVVNNYKWFKYSFSAGQIQYDAITDTGCGTDRTFKDLTGLTFAWRDESPTPPGGREPFAPPTEDNNVIEIQVSWHDPTSGVDRSYTGQATMRAGAYTDLTSGLSPVGVAPEPSSC